MASSEDIAKVLEDMRTAIDSGKFQPISRVKNMNTLTQLGITWDDAKAELYELTAADYYQGPEIDRDYPKADLLWVFKKNIGGQIIYIKFKILYLDDGSVKLISFHIDHT